METVKYHSGAALTLLIAGMVAVKIRQLTTQQVRIYQGLPFPHQLMAHRGGAFEYVENTMPAFRAAARAKVDILEMDLQLTKDRRIVIFHDNDLKRMCGVNKRIQDFNYDELPLLVIPEKLQDKSQVVDDPESKIIPLFETLLQEFPDYPMQIDLKNGPVELVQRVGNLILDLNRQDKTVWGSFIPSVNDLCYKHFGTRIPLFFGISRFLAAFTFYKLGMFKRFGLRESCLILPNFSWAMDKGFFQALNERGVDILVFGADGSGSIDTEHDWEIALLNGANGICSNSPTKLRQWLNKRN